MGKMSPADKAALRKRLQEIKESFELCATAPFSRETNATAANWHHTNMNHRCPADATGGIEKAHAQSWRTTPNSYVLMMNPVDLYH